MDIINNYRPCGVNAERIVQRVMAFVDVTGINEVRLLEHSMTGERFSRYLREKQNIELYVHDIIGWQPMILRKTFVIPYLAISVVLGREIDHHVRPDDHDELTTLHNALKYVYPSFGIFKPFGKLMAYVVGKWGGSRS
jgi:hypothetical protein